MRILVTGGAGFIGSMLVPELLKEGHKVTVLDNLTWGMKGLSLNVGKRGFNFIKGDIRDGQLISTLLEKNEAIVHLAALAGCELCERNKDEATDINVNGSRKICDYLSDEQFLILASSASVYGQANGKICTEETILQPQSHYAKTKIEAERVFSKRDNVVILRFATAFGVSFRMRLDLLVNQFVYEAIKNKALIVYGRNYVRSIIHVSDIARSIMFAIHNNESMQGQIFNVCSPESNTKEQIAEHIRKMVDCDLQFVESDLDLRNYHLSIRKIEGLGYHATVSLDQGITEIVCVLSKLKIDKTNFNDGGFA